MIMKVYSIFDSKVAIYVPPFFVRNEGEMIRRLSDWVNSGQNNDLAKHPEDYTLYFLGEWDDNTAGFVANEPSAVITAASLVTVAAHETMK